jgi:hypothetical protein
MKLTTLAPVLLLLVAAGCKSVLDVNPINEFPEEEAIINPATARAAVAGLYDALQDGSYYGGELVFFGDLSAEDVGHTGTFTTYRLIDQNQLAADNGSIEGLWDALYITIGRANIVLARIPTVPGLDPVDRDAMLGQAYFIRALTYHNLVKFWGDSSPAGLGVPIRLTPPSDFISPALVTRANTGAVYAQILSDLNQAEALIGPADQRRVGLGAVRALRARVFLYQQNWAGAEAEAEAVAAMGYTLAANYSDLWPASGGSTVEDIFRLDFSPVDFNLLGYYYRAKGILAELGGAGRREITPTHAFIRLYDTAYVNGDTSTFHPVDTRGKWQIGFHEGTRYGAKYPTGVGAEDLHVIRYGEVLLTQAEAEARQGNLAQADTAINRIRARAGLPALDLVALGQAAAIDSILQERRFELAFEGDRWPDLVRTGRAVAVLAIPAFQRLYPIPLNELDVAPNLVQNTGY